MAFPILRSEFPPETTDVPRLRTRGILAGNLLTLRMYCDARTKLWRERFIVERTWRFEFGRETNAERYDEKKLYTMS